MKNTLYHFGDSFGKGNGFENSFGIKIAKHYGLKYLDFSDGGLSNEQILQKMLFNLHYFKSGDVLLINFSFLTRFLTVDPNLKLVSTARVWDDSTQSKTDYVGSFYDGRETLLDYFLNFSYEYNVKLFKTIKNLLDSLQIKGVKIYSVIIRKDNLHHGDEVFTSKEFDLGLINELDFEPSYYEWLVNKGWKNEEEGHYTKGIQDELSLEYIKRIDDIEKKISETKKYV
jgi:hypothetical protein